jgi:hypothetical protein
LWHIFVWKNYYLCDRSCMKNLLFCASAILYKIFIICVIDHTWIFYYLSDHTWNIYYLYDTISHEIFIICMTQFRMKYLLLVWSILHEILLLCVNTFLYEIFIIRVIDLTWNIYYLCGTILYEIFIICVTRSYMKYLFICVIHSFVWSILYEIFIIYVTWSYK